MAKTTEKNSLTSLLTVERLKDFKELNDAATDAKVSAVNEKISSAATKDNVAPDTATVAQMIQQSSGEHKGVFANWEAVPTEASGYKGGTAPKTNDLITVQDASDYPVDTKKNLKDADGVILNEALTGTWIFRYTGDFATVGKDGWTPFYQISSEPLTPEQMAALNSGITAEKVAQIATNTTDIASLDADLTDVEGRVSTVETSVTDLTGRVTTAETDIAGLKTSKQDVISVDDVYIEKTAANKIQLKNLASRADIEELFAE